MQADLNEIGLKTEIQTVDFGAMQPMLESGETGMDYMRWTFSDQSILSALFKTPGWVGQTSDPELDALLDVADTTVDPEARLEATHAAMTYVLDNAPHRPDPQRLVPGGRPRQRQELPLGRPRHRAPDRRLARAGVAISYQLSAIRLFTLASRCQERPGNRMARARNRRCSTR